MKATALYEYHQKKFQVQERIDTFLYQKRQKRNLQCNTSSHLSFCIHVLDIYHDKCNLSDIQTVPCNKVKTQEVRLCF